MSENKNLHEQMAELLNGLNDEQKEKAKQCKTVDELMSLLGELDIALPDELLDAVSGGGNVYTKEEALEWRKCAIEMKILLGGRGYVEQYSSRMVPKDGSCPFCGSGYVVYPFFGNQHVCMDCSWTWTVT